jgi:hypothetical protein
MAAQKEALVTKETDQTMAVRGQKRTAKESGKKLQQTQSQKGTLTENNESMHSQRSAEKELLRRHMDGQSVEADPQWQERFGGLEARIGRPTSERESLLEDEQ